MLLGDNAGRSFVHMWERVRVTREPGTLSGSLTLLILSLGLDSGSAVVKTLSGGCSVSALARILKKKKV